MVEIIKFGGSSIKDTVSIKNIIKIINQYNSKNIIVVISAMGKMTNLFENLLISYYNKDTNMNEIFNEIKYYHNRIIKDLFIDENHSILSEINSIYSQISLKLQNNPSPNYNYEYDQIVHYGEILSTIIVSAYLNEVDTKNKWLDARKIIKTDSRYRDAKIKWDLTQKNIISKIDFMDSNIYLTQGFIASTAENITTTLGREGSDFTAAIIAYCLDADNVTIWKDVPGVLNADPKYFSETIKIERMSYYDAIEMAYYGANVIHPKTIKPLQNKNIPLFVKSFFEPNNSGTIITGNSAETIIPAFIFKKNQILITISPRDFSFIAEENLRDIFEIIAEVNLKINLMQNSAICFSICTNNDEHKINKFIQLLKSSFNIKYNSGLELITIRHYDQKTISKLTKSKEILLEEKSRHNIQMVTREIIEHPDR